LDVRFLKTATTARVDKRPSVETNMRLLSLNKGA